MDSEADAGAQPSGGHKALVLSLLVGLAFVVGALVVTALLGAQDRPVDLSGTGDQARLGPVSGTESTPLPDESLEGFAAGDPPVSLAAYRGGPLVVNFWATWCAPCVAEMPEFQEVSEETAGRVAFLGVNYRDPDRDRARAFASELGITYPLAADPAGEFLAAVGGFGMPTTLFVDAAGTIVYRHTGVLAIDQLRGLLADHLEVDG